MKFVALQLRLVKFYAVFSAYHILIRGHFHSDDERRTVMIPGNKILLFFTPWKKVTLFHGKILKPISDVNFVNIANLSNIYFLRNLKTSYFITLWRCTLNAYFVVPGAQKSNQITNSMAISSLYCHWIYSYDLIF